MPGVRLVQVSKGFGRIRAVDRVSLEVQDGEYVCILGPTGSGKTTLLRLIAGLVEPDEGEVYIGNRLVNQYPPEERDAVYVPQRYALFPHITVLENVAFGSTAKGVDREEAFENSRRTLELVRLGWRADAFPEELSGGMQQRVALARGLASGAKLLLLDEPLGALDARLRVELRDKLRKLVKEQGLTAFHVTHDQEEALTVADRIIVLREGRVQQQGTPFHVYRRPENLFVANFVGGTNFLEGVVAGRERGGSYIRLRGDLQVQVQDISYLVDETVVVAVREEKTLIKADVDEEPNTLSGEVKAVRFLGCFTRYEVGLENGDTVASRVPTYTLEKTFTAGSRVKVGFHPVDAMVYPYPSLGLLKEVEVS